MTERTCAGCSGPLPSGQGTKPRKWCSEACRQLFIRRTRPEYTKRQNELAAARQRAARASRGPRRYDKTCRVCEAAFTTSKPQAQTCSKRCSHRAWHLVAAGTPERRTQLAEIAAQRKERMKGDRLDPLEVFDRDGWLCQLCDEPVDPTAKVPAPNAPTMDHVVPLAAGGAHNMENVQTAHFHCNNVKGTRIVSAGALAGLPA